MSPNPYTYLSQLRSVSDGVLERDAAWIGNFPTFDAAAAPFRTVSGEILRSVLTAIRQRQALEIRSQSPSRPEPRCRCIAPHPIGFDGSRWHAPANFHNHQIFTDIPL